MLSHAEIYANVIKARPECAVGPRTVRGTSLFWRDQVDEDGRKRDCEQIGWSIGDDGFDAVLCGGDDAPIAIALITDHWTEMLPEGRFVLKSAGTYATMIDVTHAVMWYPTRYHALAEFLVPGSTKEKA